MKPRLRALAIALVALAPPLDSAPAQASGLPPIGHVFIVVLENESASTTFAPNSPAPYLARTLTGEGAYLPNYDGIGHESNDNYIALISGQAPNPQNQGDCQNYNSFEPDVIGSDGQAIGSGCIFPSDVQTIADQLDAAGLTWRDYNEGMGSDPTRESTVCGHPGVGRQDNTQSATATDQYATRHNPFVYFHSIIDDTTRCDTHVVNLDLLPRDLASAASTPNYVFITPDLCSDGHDPTCAAPGRPGGFAGIDSFLSQWVPRITGSPAFRTQNGLLAIVFDETSNSDASSCCGEVAGPNSPAPGITGPGGGDTGAVLISPCIAPGTVSTQPYNHYTLLRSVEDVFRLAHLGYAQLSGERSLGSDVFNRPCGSAPAAHVLAPMLASAVSAGPVFKVSWSATAGSTATVQVRRTSAGGGGWRTLRTPTSARSLKFHAREGATYEFRVRATGPSDIIGAWATARTVVPSATRVAGARYRGAWRLARFRDAWNGHALVGSAGATLTLAYRGGALAVIGDTSPRGGRIRVTIDGRSRTVGLRSSRPHARRVLFRVSLRPRRHTLVIRVLAGPVPIEALAITNRRR